MKKILISIVVIVLLVVLSDKIYKFYSRSNVNSHESIILINNQLAENEIDSFFNIEEGTYKPNEHKLVFSLVKKDKNLLDFYKNLPVKHKAKFSSNTEFDCDSEYENVRHYGFYDYEISNRIIIARIITKKASNRSQLNSKEIVSKKQLRGNYSFGKINIFDVNKNGLKKHCR
jgi:hypothetical protein